MVDQRQLFQGRLMQLHAGHEQKSEAKVNLKKLVLHLLNPDHQEETAKMVKPFNRKNSGGNQHKTREGCNFGDKCS